MDDQLRTDNMPTIMELYEAMLSMPIRMRVGPTLRQEFLDMISSKNTFAVQRATTDSCIDFVTMVRHCVHLYLASQNQLIQDLKGVWHFLPSKTDR